MLRRVHTRARACWFSLSLVSPQPLPFPPLPQTHARVVSPPLRSGQGGTCLCPADAPLRASFQVLLPGRSVTRSDFLPMTHPHVSRASGGGRLADPTAWGPSAGPLRQYLEEQPYCGIRGSSAALGGRVPACAGQRLREGNGLQPSDREDAEPQSEWPSGQGGSSEQEHSGVGGQGGSLAAEAFEHRRMGRIRIFGPCRGGAKA